MAEQDAVLIECIETAARVVDKAELPEQLRGAAFEGVLGFLLRGPNPEAGSLSPSVDLSSATSEAAAAVAARLKVAPQMLERTVEFDEEGAHIIASRSQFDSKKSTAIQEIALLVAASRQAGKLEEWTPLSLVRRTSEDLGVEDRGNFATHIKNLTGVRQRGSGRTGEIKVNSVGFERTKALVERLSGD